MEWQSAQAEIIRSTIKICTETDKKKDYHLISQLEKVNDKRFHISKIRSSSADLIGDLKV